MNLTDVEVENARLHIALDVAQTEIVYLRRKLIEMGDALHDFTEAVEPIFLQL